MAELLEDVATRQAALGPPVGARIPSGHLSRGEELLLHVSVFVSVSGSVLLANLGQDPHHLWFWPWAAGLAVVQIVYWVATHLPSGRSTRQYG
jgi:hypothetical protein